ncbi:MAG: L-asparaginase 1, partial [Muribaculaceae bacterium]|nr:L-asparaginase 1 [Muribaculaceae bacterium]
LHHYTGMRPLRMRGEMDCNVMFLDLFPGITESTLCHQLATPGIRGIVLKTFGAGNTPSGEWFVNAIRKAVESGIVIVNVTQCVNGSVHEKRYVSSDRLASAGVISGHDITSEAAITKLMYLFGQNLSNEDVKVKLHHSLAGEITTTH